MKFDSNLKIKDWALSDRPREKLLEKGLQSMSDVELLAILLCNGTKNETVIDLSRRVLSYAGNNIKRFSEMTVQELMKIKGIGMAKAVLIVSVFELGRRRREMEIIQQDSITSSEDAFEIMMPLVGGLKYEEFWVLFLNRAKRIIAKEKFSQGGTTGTIVDIKMVMKRALELLAEGVLLVHNHPSGNTEPSAHDLKVTNSLVEAGRYFDIEIVDHVIIGGGKFFSFVSSGLIAYK